MPALASSGRPGIGFRRWNPRDASMGRAKTVSGEFVPCVFGSPVSGALLFISGRPDPGYRDNAAELTLLLLPTLRGTQTDARLQTLQTLQSRQSRALRNRGRGVG